MLKTAKTLFAALSVSFFIPAVSAVTADVELVTDAEFLQPTSTLEFRFAKPLIDRDQVGTVAALTPIEIQPSLSGRFTWLSRQSGVFVPDSPPRLGTEYTLTIRPGVQAIDGSAVGQTFRTVVRTPSFAITVAQLNGGSSEDVSPQAEVRIACNLEVRPDDALFHFVNNSGETVNAVVRYATTQDYFNVAPENLDWFQRWQKPQNSKPENEEETAPKHDRLVVIPVAPLQPGPGWRLEIAPGLRSLSGDYQITQSRTVPLGVVRPFTLTGITPTNYIHSGRALQLEFSRDFAPDIRSENARNFFQIVPGVENLRFEADSQNLTIRGDFKLGQEYRLTVSPEVVDAFGLPLEGGQTRPFQFEPVKPRLYLPTTVGDQYRGGNPQFKILSVNIRRIRVKAAIVDPVDIPAAMEAFSKYTREESSDNPGEIYQPIQEGKIRARVIYDRILDVSPIGIDTEQKTGLNWREIAGNERGGTIFLTVEGEAAGENRRVGAQALVQLTDIGLLWAKEKDQFRAFVFSLTSGLPLSGAQVRFLDEHFAEIARVQSDDSGSGIVPFSSAMQWLTVRHEGATYALRLGEETKVLPAAGFNLSIWYPSWNATANSETVRAFLFADRPLYRPGETIRLKGLVRDLDKNGVTAPSGWVGTLKMTDPRGDTVFQKEVRTDTRGAFDAEVPLKLSANGRHSIRVEFGNESGDLDRPSAGADFEVADFEPNAFELKLAMPEHLSPPDPVHASISANYFFGAPITRATLRWTLQYAPVEFSPEGFDLFSFAAVEPQPKTATFRGNGSYDGVFQIQPQLPSGGTSPFEGVLTVEMTDLNQQTVTESRVFRKDATTFYLGVARPEEDVLRAGASIPVRVVAVQPDGSPATKPVEIQVELVRKRYDTVRVKGAGSAVSFRSEKVEEQVGRWSGKSVLPVWKGVRWEVPDGETCRIIFPTAGEYLVRAKANDPQGRLVATEYTLYVSGEDAVAWDYRNAAQIDLLPDKTEYHPGDTARILLKSPFAGNAVVTVARGDQVLRSMHVALAGNTPTLELPIAEGDVPNVFVSAVLIRGSEGSTRKVKTPEFRYGIAMLSVIDPATRLQVAVQPAKESVQPGETVETEVTVRDNGGDPVSDAEITFFAVDDGVLALTGYKRPDPHATFYKPFPLNLRTGLTLDSLLPEDPQDLQFTNKGYLIGGGGLDMPGMKLRTDFPGTACWAPSLRTNREGRASIRFPAPDALTRYRLVAVANAGSGQFGSAESAVAIRKPLMVLPSMARFARSGDQIVARAVIRNETGADENVYVQLLLDAKAESTHPTAATLSVPAGGVRTLDFPVRFGDPGTSHWRWSAESGPYIDRVNSAIEVSPAGPVLQETYLTDLTENTTDLLGSINPQIREGRGTVTVSLSNTRLTSLRESVDQLRLYPYSCTEQTASALVPWLVRDELSSALLTRLQKMEPGNRRSSRLSRTSFLARPAPEAWRCGREKQHRPFLSALTQRGYSQACRNRARNCLRPIGIAC